MIVEANGEASMHESSGSALETSDAELLERSYLQELAINNRLGKIRLIESYRDLNRQLAVDLHNKGYDVSVDQSEFAGRNAVNLVSGDPSNTRERHEQLTKRHGKLRSRLFVFQEVCAIVAIACAVVLVCTTWILLSGT